MQVKVYCEELKFRETFPCNLWLSLDETIGLKNRVFAEEILDYNSPQFCEFQLSSTCSTELLVTSWRVAGDTYVFDMRLKPHAILAPPTELALRYSGELHREEKLWILPSRIANSRNVRFVCKVPRLVGSVTSATLTLRNVLPTTKLDVEEVRWVTKYTSTYRSTRTCTGV